MTLFVLNQYHIMGKMYNNLSITILDQILKT